MAIGNHPGTLGATQYQGSQPIAHSATKITTGTLSSLRLPAIALGTASTPGTTLGALIAPPGSARYVILGVGLNPGVAQSSGVSLTQRVQGTIATALSPATGQDIDVTLAGFVLPGQGSYIARQVGTANAALRSWREYYHR